jgi:cobalt-zinc-cadmium efflux system membrane fusion protein
MGVAALVLIAITAGCGEPAREAAAPAPRVESGRVVFPASSPQVAVLSIAEAKPSTAQTLQIPARLVWDEDVTARIYAPFAGRIARIEAKPGDRVAAGQVLARVASPDFGEAQAAATKAAADVALAEQTLARVQELVENGVAPRKDLLEAQAQLKRAAAHRSQAAQRVAIYSGGSSVDASLGLRSPLAGAVVERNVNPGQELRPEAGADRPLFVVTDPTRLWITLDASERDLAYLRPGLPIAFRAAPFGDERFAAKLDVVGDALDRETRTVRARGSLANPDRRLKGEMFVTAEIETPAQQGVSVPAKAVFLIGTTQYVFVEEAPGRYARVAVQAGPERGGVVTLASGVAPGQRIVIEGSLFLQHIYQRAGGQ